MYPDTDFMPGSCNYISLSNNYVKVSGSVSECKMAVKTGRMY